MPTLGETIAAIRDDINRGSDFDARIQKAIVNAIEFYKGRRYKFNTRRTEITLAGEYTSFSVDLIQIDYLTLLASNYRKPLQRRTPAWINDHRRDISFSAEPVFFAAMTRAIRLDCPPDQTYSASIFYHYHLTGISLSTSDTATTNAWLSDAYELITCHAMAEVYEKYIQGPEALQQAQVMKQRAADFEPELKGIATSDQKSGHIKGCI